MTSPIDLKRLTDRQLLAQRRRLAASVERPELTLPGALVRQGRRCSSSGCRCWRGELHGPYLYLTLYRDGRNRSLYVPAALEAVVGEYVGVSDSNETVLAEIASVNLELLARRKLG
ncbi:MAG: DUF6788 family protein [Solirubrobacteraceae bacterium]